MQSLLCSIFGSNLSGHHGENDEKDEDCIAPASKQAIQHSDKQQKQLHRLSDLVYKRPPIRWLLGPLQAIGAELGATAFALYIGNAAGRVNAQLAAHVRCAQRPRLHWI
eukprot:TRINITY_DN18766_c0_g1_i1.p3 TRINITY_DN18766_c0_g1~~TRINITY_DN18766_c0_g1_i1.p3  ORF type:complete len:109 (+),score=1.62 TRINITY_DN18766_c0_g1_i1:2100-2426(+)